MNYWGLLAVFGVFLAVAFGLGTWAESLWREEGAFRRTLAIALLALAVPLGIVSGLMVLVCAALCLAQLFGG